MDIRVHHKADLEVRRRKEHCLHRMACSRHRLRAEHAAGQCMHIAGRALCESGAGLWGSVGHGAHEALFLVVLLHVAASAGALVGDIGAQLRHQRCAAALRVARHIGWKKRCAAALGLAMHIGWKKRCAAALGLARHIGWKKLHALKKLHGDAVRQPPASKQQCELTSCGRWVVVR